LAAGTTTVGSLAAYVSSVLTSSLPNYTAACRGENNTIYVVGGFFGDVYSISTSGVVTTIANSTVSAYPTGIAYYDGSVYVVDSQSSQIKKVVISNGVVTTFAGSGGSGFTDNVAGTNAQFSAPQGIAVDSQGNLYVLDTGNRRIRKITTAAVVSTVAGTGTPVYADGVGGSFRIPTQILSTSTGDLWVVDTNSSNVRVIRYVTVSTGEIRTLDTSGTLATNPTTPYNVDVLNGFAIDPADVLYIISDTTLTKRQGNTLTSVSLGITTNFGAIVTSLFDILAFNIGPVVRRFSPGSLSAGSVSATSLNTGTITASGAATVSSLNAGSGAITTTGTLSSGAATIAGNLSVTAGAVNVTTRTYGTSAALVTSYTFRNGKFASDGAGNFYGRKNADGKFYKVTSSGTETFIAGDGDTSTNTFTPGTGAAVRFGGYVGSGTNEFVMDSLGNIFTVHYSAFSIVKIAQNGVVSRFAGTGVQGSQDGAGATATFNLLLGIAIDASDTLYVSEFFQKKIRVITKNAVVSTLTFTTSVNPSFYSLAVIPSGTILYALDTSAHQVFKITPTSSSAADFALLAGSTQGYANGQGSAAQFNISVYQSAIRVDPFGTVLVTDSSSVRRISSAGDVTTLIGSATAIGAGSETTTQLSYPSITLATDGLYTGTQVIRKISFTDVVSVVNLEGKLNVSNGTVSAPVYTFINDLSTGLYRPASNAFGIVTGGVERIRVLSNGYVGIGTTNPQQLLDISGGSARAVSFITTSDRRVKNNIQSISNALDIVKGLRGVYYTRIGNTQRDVGVIAQEVEEVLPEVVHTSGDDLKSVSYGNMVSVLVEAVKTLSERLETLEKKG
jgi:ATP-dependent protease HslVU (ClpYQ) peptidase subunit